MSKVDLLMTKNIKWNVALSLMRRDGDARLAWACVRESGGLN